MMQTLTDAELDVVSAGAASATLGTDEFTTPVVIAIGPNAAMVTTESVVSAQTVAGLEPSNTAFVSVQFTATSN